jgi:hypothetical protein
MAWWVTVKARPDAMHTRLSGRSSRLAAFLAGRGILAAALAAEEAAEHAAQPATSVAELALALLLHLIKSLRSGVLGLLAELIATRDLAGHLINRAIDPALGLFAQATEHAARLALRGRLGTGIRLLHRRVRLRHLRAGSGCAAYADGSGCAC